MFLLRNNLGKIVFCVLLAVGGMIFYLTQARPVYRSRALLEVTPTPQQGEAVSEADTAETLKTVEMKLASQSVLLAVIRENQLARDPEFVSRDDDSSPAGFRWLNDTAAQWRQWFRGKAGGRLAGSGSTDDLSGESADAKADEKSATPAAMDTELVKRFGSRVSVNLVRGSRLVAIAVDDHDPKNAQRLTHSVIEEFFRQARDQRQHDSAGSRELRLAEAKRLAEEVKASEERLESYRKQYNAVSLQERQNIVVERLRDLNQQVAAAKNTRLTREAEYQQVQRFSATAPDRLLSIRAVAELPEILDRRKQVALQEAQVANLAQRYGPLHPTMVQARSELDELRSGLRDEILKAGRRIRETFESAKATEAALQSALAAQEKAALELDRIAIPYHALERELQANATAYQKLLDELKQSDVNRGLVTESNLNGIDIRVVEPPLVPAHPAAPRGSLLLGLSLVTGLFVGCGLALGSRALNNTILTVDAAETMLGTPVLAVVPRSRHHRLDRRPIVLRFPASAQAEAFRSLRTALSLLGPDDEQRCVLFTSAVPGEGKSFCALNCAASIAQQGLRTLLIDADLRRPGLLRLFSNPDETPQLSDCLANAERFDAAVQRTALDHLYCLGDWQHHAGSAERIARDGMNEIIRRALATFDRVVIDTAPLMAVSDTLHIARHVATICLVIYAGKTPRPMVLRAMKQLREVAKRAPAGLVLNKVNSRAAGAHYYYYNA